MVEDYQGLDERTTPLLVVEVVKQRPAVPHRSRTIHVGDKGVPVGRNLHQADSEPYVL